MPRGRRVLTLAERRALMLRRSELSTVAQLPSWEVLAAVVEEEIDAIKGVIMSKVMSGGISEAEQAFHRGRIIGLRAALSIPRHALQRELTESSPRREEVAAGE